MERTALKILIILLLITSLTGCHQNLFNRDNTRIEGCFSNFSGKRLIFNEVEVRTFTPLDTLKLDEDGCFRHSIDLEQPGIFLLKLDQGNYLTLVLKPGQEVVIRSDMENIRTGYSVEGSQGSEKLRDFEIAYNKKKAKLEEQANASDRSFNQTLTDRRYAKTLDSLVSAHKAFVTNQVRSEPASLANLIMLNRRFVTEKVFDQYDDFEIFALVDSALMELYPENKHVKDHHFRVEQARYRLRVENLASERLAAGRKAPEIKLETPSGETVKLSSLQGNPVVLYFWASSDAPSRKANQQLVKLYNKYKNKGLKVYAVSLDKYEEMWKAAIRIDKLEWINVSDLSGMGSPVSFMYDIPEDLPYIFLIDREGKIIMKTGKIQELEEHISRLLE